MFRRSAAQRRLERRDRHGARGSRAALATVQFSEGHRVLGVAYREFPMRTNPVSHRDDESRDDLCSALIVLSDPPKRGIGATIDELRAARNPT